jgi:aromatic-L-amino-acid decarboxylase
MFDFQGDRNSLLKDVAVRVSQVWASFDSARENEPEISAKTTSVLSEDLPRSGRGESETLSQAVGILDQSTAQSRPRFFAYIGSSGLEMGAVADFLASSYDINLAVDSKAATMLERQAARWIGQFIGYDDNAKGLFTSGGTISNITALAAARSKRFPNARKNGVSDRVAIYCSSEAHYSNIRAVELLGFGSGAIRSIAIDQDRRMQIDEFEAQIRRDLEDGVVPLAVIASSGTTLTGAVDPLDAIADICDRYGIWMHVDGAYGAPAAGTAKAKDLFKGLHRADSVTIDAHKWLFVPKACSIVLMKNYEPLLQTFSHNEAYMPHDSDEPNAVDITLEYSRPVRALKMWMGFAAHGADEFEAAITANLDLAELTYDTADQAADFRVLANRPQLSIVPIQFAPAGVKDVSGLNRRIYEAILEDGRIYLSPATIDGKIWLRPCYTNFRTTEADVEALFEVIRDLGQRLAPEFS